MDPEQISKLVEQYISPNHIWGALIYLALLFALGLVLSRLLKVFVRITLSRDRLGLIDPTATEFLRQFSVAIMWVVLAVIYAHLIPALRSLGTALLAGVSIVGVVVGLAAQNTLGNVISGIALLIYRPFKIGDRLQMESPTGVEIGTVESLSLGYVTLKTLDNRRIVVPNSVAATKVIVNLSTLDPKALVVIPITLNRSADIAKARGILLDVAANIPDVLETEGCPVTQVKAQEVKLSLRLWCRGHAVTSKVKAEFLEQAGSRFATTDIELGIG